MWRHTTTPLIVASVLLLTAGFAAADGQADRSEDSSGEPRSYQAPAEIEAIHDTLGATAAGPASKETKLEPKPSTTLAMRNDFPEGINTAYQRKRYLFDSNQI